MPIRTAHGTVIVAEAQSGRLRHVPMPAATPHTLVDLSHLQQAGYLVERISNSAAFHLTRRRFYLSAQQRSDALDCDRSTPGAWETFTLVSESALEQESGDTLAAAFLREYQLGRLKQAVAGLSQVVAHYPGNQTAQLHLGLARALLDPPPSAPPEIILQCTLADLWEHDWLRFLLGDLFNAPTEDGDHQVFASRMIVVDHALDAAKAAYYREAFNRGHRICLIHLSDEAFLDEHYAYPWCHTVWRNYWSPILARQPNVRFFPLGYKSGFATGTTPPSASERRHVWSFAGDAKKSTRPQMLDAMERLPGGHTHLTAHFGSTDALPTSQYRVLLEESIFAPCPGGLSNLETFRVYEALDAGAIPILECRPHFDYFRHLLGDHPMPTIAAWDEAPGLIARIQAANGANHLQRSCMAWWRVFKRALQGDFAASIKALDTPRY